MRRLSAILAVSCCVAAATCFAQSAPTPPAAPASPTRPAANGEPWTAITLYEHVSAGDSQPSKRQTQQTVCVAPGKFALSGAASTDLPAEYREKCWVENKREERNRKQVKYGCTDGMTAEAVVRREPDGSYGSKFVVNQPGKGGVAVTRTFQRAFGFCDRSKVSPEVPVSMFKDVPPEPPKETPSAEK